MKKISDDKIKTIKELKLKGKSNYAIAKELDISAGSVNYHLKGPAKKSDDVDNEISRLRRQNKLLIEIINDSVKH